MLIWRQPEGIPPTRPTLGLRGTAPHASWAPGGADRAHPETITRATQQMHPTHPQRLVGKPPGAPSPGIRPSRPHPHTRASVTQEPPAGSSGMSGARGSHPSPPAQPPGPPGSPSGSRGAAQHGVGAHTGAHSRGPGTQTLALPTQSRHGPDTHKGQVGLGSQGVGCTPPDLCPHLRLTEHRPCPPCAPVSGAPRAPPAHRSQGQERAGPSRVGWPGVGGTWGAVSKHLPGKTVEIGHHRILRPWRPPRRDTQGQHNKYKGPPDVSRGSGRRAGGGRGALCWGRGGGSGVPITAGEGSTEASLCPPLLRERREHAQVGEVLDVVAAGPLGRVPRHRQHVLQGQTGAGRTVGTARPTRL